MPGPVIKFPRIDAANVASKLPEPLRKPAGMTLQAILDLVGAEDPMSGAYPPMMAAGPRALLDDAVRMSRAKAQGYTTPVWHGTNKAFSEFQGPIRNDHGDFGIHVATSPYTASKAVGENPLDDAVYPFTTGSSNKFTAGRMIMPLLAKIKKSFEVGDRGLWRTPSNWTNYPGESALKKTTNDPDTLEQILQVARQHTTAKSNKPLANVIYDPQNSLKFQSQLKDILQSRGYDSIKYPNNVEGLGEPSYLLLDPTQVRSRFANFDPDKVNSKDIMASILAGTGLYGSSKDK